MRDGADHDPWVAEYELALGLAALRRIPRSTGWSARDSGSPTFPTTRPGRTACKDGGSVSRVLARSTGTLRASSGRFETEWEAYDPFVPAERIRAAGGQKADSLVALAGRSEIMFVATPPNPTTLKLIDRAVIDALPTGAVFVLVSRMAVVDQEPLLDRLRAGQLRAAIDVFEPEPPPLGSEWRTLPNVIHTPHRAGNTRGAHNGIFTEQCAEARRYFTGESQYPLRPELVALFKTDGVRS